MRIRWPGAAATRRLRETVATRWLDRRVPREAPRIHLHRRRLFILPTAFGYIFALTLAVLLLGSLNYGTSLGFAITFLLAGAGAVAMIHTYRNLQGLEVAFDQPPPVFAGDPIRLPVHLRTSGLRRWAVRLEGGDGPAPVRAPDAGAPADAELRFDTRRRGRFRPPRLRITTTWPFGLLRVWSWVWPDIEGLVYPARVDHGLPRPERAAAGAGDRTRAGGDEDFAGLRDYRPGDSPRRIAWPVYARTGDVLVKTFESEPAGDRWFDWTALGALGPEERLEQLCFWVVEADRAGQRYGLALPDRRLEPDSGPVHRTDCLEALALMGTAPTEAA